MTDIPPGDAIALLRRLVSVDSRNPSLVPGAPGEGAVAEALAQVLRAWGFRTELMEVASGRPNVVARIGKPGGRTLLFNGHLDVVGVDGMLHAPFSAEERDGRIYGRGSCDMKGGVAAMCAAAARAAAAGLDGEVIVSAVVDEEYESLGTRGLVASGLRADAAIVTEPTRLAVNPAHRGFVWVELDFRGRAAHGSRYDLGVDAIRHAGLLIAALDTLQRDVLTHRTHPLLGHASLHLSTIEGGSGWSTYPDRCTLRIERRTLPGETTQEVLQEVAAACERVAAIDDALDVELRHILTQGPSDVAGDATIVQALERAMRAEGETILHEGMSAWTDAALLNDAGIPAICYGPGDIILAHADEEWIPLDEVERSTRVLTRLAREWMQSAV
ncbi:MAG: ArgE/DapE family deacylase [Gemmatimonadaceae bacterium]|nr:ArgE/DapE family deacylase [Gemmatimonadaceae bacterium]